MTIEPFKIKSYGRTELALLYSPDDTPQSAYRKLCRWINRYPHLNEDLCRAGYNHNTRTYTPNQVRLIVEALGEP